MITQIDLSILDFIQLHMKNAAFDVLAKVFDVLGKGGIVLIALGILLLCFRQTRKLGFLILVSLAIEALFCNVIIKPLVQRPRPWTITGVTPGAYPKDFSFPSGHTGATFAVVGALCGQRLAVVIPAWIFGILMGFFRMYLYVHYPSDVLVGMLLGLISSVLARFLIQKVSQKLEERKQKV